MIPIARRALACVTGVLLCAVAHAETDWVLVLDRSESMTQNDPLQLRFDAQKILVHLLAQGTGETHRLTIIRFAGTPEAVLVREPITTEKLDSIRKTIAEDPPRGDTDIGAALALARRVSQPEGRASDVHIILLSDGVQAGRIPNLQERLASEQQAYSDAGLIVDTILLNDHSLSADVRQARRKQKSYYDDKQLQVGSDLLREIARRTGGQSAEVRPDRGIEDILLSLLAPRFSFHRQPVSARVETWPTDRQLFLFLDRRSSDLKLRAGAQELNISLSRSQTITGDFEAFVDAYRNRTVVTLRPGANVRWPSHIELLPGPSGLAPVGDIYVISNVSLSAVPGVESEAGAPGGFKRRVREHELYPVRFRIGQSADMTPERAHSVEEALKKSQVRVELLDAEEHVLEEKTFPTSDILNPNSARLYFVPTFSPRNEGKQREPFTLVVRSVLEAASGGLSGGSRLRPLSRAPDRSIVVEPSPFEWVVRRNWKGEPASASRPLGQRQLEVELGQEIRFEVLYHGQAPLGEVSLQASFGKVGEPAATRFPLKDAGGVPRAFHTDWIFLYEPGEYEARVRAKTDGVQELTYLLRVVRDDFRAADSRYSRDGTDTATGRDLGSYFAGETVALERQRTIHRLTPEATAKHWEAESAVPGVVSLLRRDAASGGWAVVGQVPIAPQAPATNGAELRVAYRGEAPRLEPGLYLAAWPEKRPIAADPAADQRSDRFQILGPAFRSTFVAEDGKPLPVENGKPTALAGAKIQLKVTPSSDFPTRFEGTLRATLTWARKAADAPQTVDATRGSDGSFALYLPVKDFDSGPAKVHLEMAWKEGGAAHQVTEDHEIFTRTKALNVLLEPLDDGVLIGHQGAAIRFRLRAVGGINAEAQRDLLSVWRSQPAAATIGESEQVYTVDLAEEQGSLVGSLPLPALEEGNYKLVVSSPVAKLGQDSAACFFDVRPCPHLVTLIWSSPNAEEKPMLATGTAQATCDGDGSAIVVLEPRPVEASKAATPKAKTAELLINGAKASVRWQETGGKLRSDPLPLEGFERQNQLDLAIVDESGRSFSIALGKLEVVPVPLTYEATWTKAPPAVLGRGELVRVRGAVEIRGGFRSQREEARRAVEQAGTAWVTAKPPSVLTGLELLPPGEAGGASGMPRGSGVHFGAVLRADANDASLRDSFLVVLQPPRPGADAAAPVLETKKVSIGPAAHQLQIGRLDDQGAVTPPGALPFLAREQVRIRVEAEGGSGAVPRIQVLAGGESGAAELTIAETRGAQLDFVPKKDGPYRVTAELQMDPDRSWAIEERIAVSPPLRLEWGQAVASALKLDAGQKLPLAVKVLGPPGLDTETFQRWFTLRPELFSETGQPLPVEHTPWEAGKDNSPGALLLTAYSVQPLESQAAKVRVHLVQRFGPADAPSLDTITLDLVRGGGSLVAVDGFESGPGNYEVKDLASGFHVPRRARIRFGYRLGGSLDAAESLQHGVAAIIVGPDGVEKVLDVDAVANDLVVFTPYEAGELGHYTLRLEIRGKTPLRRDFEMEVVKGTTEWALIAAVATAGGILLIGLVLLSLKGFRYRQDRKVVVERADARRDKALTELAAEPSQTLVGSVRLSIASQSIGPIDLKGSPTTREVESWVDQHFSMEASIFSDTRKNERRRELIQSVLNGARTALCFEAERRLPVRAAEICVRDSRGGPGKLEAEIIQESTGPRVEGLKALLTLRLIADGKLRISTASGRSVTLSPSEDFPYNGWIGKQGGQIRASVKVPGIADYATLIIDLKF